MAGCMKNVKMPFCRVFDGVFEKIQKIDIFSIFHLKTLIFLKKKVLDDFLKIRRKKNCFWKNADIEGVSGHCCPKSARFWIYEFRASFWCKHRDE